MRKWNIIHKKSFRCCGCRDSCMEDDAVYAYKNTCLCRKCFDKLEFVEGRLLFFGEIYEDFTFSPFYYKGLFRDIFLKFKFNGSYAFGHIIGMAAAERLKGVEELYGYDCVVPVPLSNIRYRDRGFNQSEIMAGYVAKELGIKIDKLLIRHGNAKPQSVTNTSERNKNVRNVFEVCGSAAGKKIILFDDIHTTGSTLNECRTVLEAAGAEEVCFVTAAYVYRGEDG